MGLRSLPPLLFQTLNGLVSARPRVLLVNNGSLTVADDGTTTLNVGGGGGGSVAVDAIWDAKGDLAVGTGADTAAKLAAGTDGFFLKADSAQSTGLVWVAAPGTGTVTSVAASVPAEFSIAGSPVTVSGTLAITKAVQDANKVWAGPGTGSPATSAFRLLVAADIPAIPESGVTSLVADLAAKAAAVHTHAESDVTSLTADLALKAPLASPTFSGTTTAPYYVSSGLTGAGSGGRWVGTTASGAPTSGTFVTGDYVNTLTAKFYGCTAGGTPGTWVQVGAGGAASMTIEELDAAPSVSATTLKFPNGTITDNGGGSVTYTPPANSVGTTLALFHSAI